MSMIGSRNTDGMVPPARPFHWPARLAKPSLLSLALAACLTHGVAAAQDRRLDELEVLALRYATPAVVERSDTSALASRPNTLIRDPAPGTNPARPVLTGVVGGAVGKVQNVVAGATTRLGVDKVLTGTTHAVTGILGEVTSTTAGVIEATTGSAPLAGTVDALGNTLKEGTRDTVASLLESDLQATVDALASTTDTLVQTTTSGVSNTLNGVVGTNAGIAPILGLVPDVVGGVTGGVRQTSAQLTGAQTQMVAPTAAADPHPRGLVVSNGGLAGSVKQLVDPVLSELAGGADYVTTGGTSISRDNIQKVYSSVQVLGLPIIETSLVGNAIEALGGASTASRSNLTLVGSVRSDSYLTNVNDGDPGGLLGLLLPDGAPAYAEDCINVVGLVKVKCWGVNPAQDYQTLIGEGATANGSRTVVIGSGASHTLPTEDARAMFTDGFVDANYDGRKGQSVVIGDHASGTANAQTILGVRATSSVANSVALGHASNASRGAQAGYTAFGLDAAQNSAGEVAIGAAGNERQITHVAAGSTDTDAVNVAQLRGAISLIDEVDGAAIKYDVDGAGAIDLSRATLAGPGGTTIANLAAGIAADEAVNVAQLTGVTDALGGGAQVDPTTGAVLPPVYTLADGNGGTQTYNNVGTALENLDGRTSTNTTNITNLLDGTAGLVQQDPTTLVVSVAGTRGGTTVDFSNASGEARRLRGVANAQADDEAVNLAQLRDATTDLVATDPLAVRYDTDVDGNATNRVTLAGGNAAAPVLLTNVANGEISATSSDAINGAQLFESNTVIASYFGGGTAFDPVNGSWIQPTFEISLLSATGGVSGGTYNNVGDAFAAIDSSLLTLNNRINNIDTGGNGGTPSPYLAVDSSGPAASANGVESVAIGPGASTGAADAVAIGSGAASNHAGSVALGAGATTSVGAQSGYDGAFVEAGTSESVGEVSVGSVGAERQVTNVADGSARYDAVNVGQLQGGVEYAINESKSYTDQQIINVSNNGSTFRVNDTSNRGTPNASGADATAGGAGAVAAGANSTALGSGATASAENSIALGAGSVADRAGTLSVGRAGGERVIANVGAGVRDTDAVNLGQLNQAFTGSKAYTDERFEMYGRELQRVDTRAAAGIAAAMAMAGLPQPFEAGKSMASIAASTFNGESSVALGLSGVSEGGRWIYKIGGSANSRGDSGVTIGTGVQW